MRPPFDGHKKTPLNGRVNWNQSLYGWECPVWLKVKPKCSFFQLMRKYIFIHAMNTKKALTSRAADIPLQPSLAYPCSLA